MRVEISTPTRAGLAGNPSDGYGGRAVAVALSGFAARVTIGASPDVRIEGPGENPLRFPSLRSLLDEAPVTPGSPHRLVVCACRRFFSAALERGWLASLPSSEGFDLEYRSDIPREVGLAGSSALAVSVLRALAGRYAVAIPETELPAVALSVETRLMGIHGGLMDRIAQVHGGVVYMDLAADRLETGGEGSWHSLPDDRLPPLFIAWSDALAAGSETVHNALKKRVRRRDAEALSLLAELASLADAARRVLLSGRPADLLPIMDANFDLRARLLEVGDGNRLLVETGRRLGAGVKQAGSGGAVVGAHDGDPDRVERLRLAYGRIGAHWLAPGVWRGPTTGSTPGEGERPPHPRKARGSFDVGPS